MYSAFYSLSGPPFENTPDPRFFYASEQHREALAALEYTIRMHKGFVMVTGAPGLGKTMIANMLIERCHDAALIFRIMHGHRTGDELLRQVMRHLNVPHPSHDDHARRLERLQAHLSGQMDTFRPVVLMVDEAQTLCDEALEELRLLTNLDTATQKLVQVVLLGHPALRRRLRAPHLIALRQRLVMAKQLHPLSRPETEQYIAHRLRVASLDPNRAQIGFSQQAVAAVDKFAGGRPRLINLVCDNCLLLGFVGRVRDQLSQSIVHQVIRDMLPSLEGSGPSEPIIVANHASATSRSLSEAA